MRKMRIIIVYELDDPTATLESERRDWIEGNVDIHDIIATDGFVDFTIIEENPND